MHELTRAEACRIAVHAQYLSDDRPADLEGLARRLAVIQNDPTTAVARSADLVAWGRLGTTYRPGDVDRAVADGTLVELQAMLRPAEDIALFTAEMAAWPGIGELTDWQEEQRDWVEANDGCRRDILDKLHDEGPLPSRALPDTTVLPWQSSGWNNDRNVRMLLGLMVRRGEVAAAGSEGRERLWDLAERVYPDVRPVPPEQAERIRLQRRLASLGIARARSTELPGESTSVGESGEPAVVEGVRGRWRVDPAYLGVPAGTRTVLLSPLDRLVYDRKRTAELFDFDYQLEMYKPAAKRRWGYWAMPVLHRDRLVGKLDAAADRQAGVLRVHAVHEDEPFDRTLRAAVDQESAELARWLDLELVRED